MRVLFVSTGYPSFERPNYCVFTHRSIKSLLPYVDVEVLTFRTWFPGCPFVERRHWEGVNVITAYCPQSPLDSHLHLNTHFLTSVGKLVLGNSIKNYDLIHSADLYPAGFIAQRLAKQYGKPHTSHVIGSDVNYFLTSNLKRIGSDWLLGIRGFACNSYSILQNLLGLVSQLKNLQVIYRGVDISVFNPEGFASGPQSSFPPVRFLFLGGFHSSDTRSPLYALKGGPILLDAWKLVEASISPSSLLIGGPGINMDWIESWRSNLKRPEATFLSRVVLPSDVPSLLRACDVLVVPSLSEGMPNIANEAQACGRAVLGSDAGGIPESIVNGETGRIVARGSVEDLASGMEWFFNNYSAMYNMGQRGRARIVDNFSWDIFAKKMVNLFWGVL